MPKRCRLTDLDSIRFDDQGANMNVGPMLSPMAMAADMEQLNDGTGYVSMGGHLALPVGYVSNEIQFRCCSSVSETLEVCVRCHYWEWLRDLFWLVW
jgi:hypothetical protein